VTQSIQATGITQPERAPAHAIDDHVRDLPPEVLSKMPLRPALKRSVNRARQAHLPTNPQTLADLRELPQEFKLTTKGERFLLYDSYEDGELNDDEDPEDDPRILIFYSGKSEKARSIQDVVLRWNFSSLSGFVYAVIYHSRPS